jgi:endonuclease-3
MNPKILKQLSFMKKNSKAMRLAAEKWKSPWQTLISTILSARTRDEKTIPIAKKLFQKYSSVNKLAKANIKDVQGIIRPVNFYRNKSKSVINCSKVIVEEHKGKIPKNIDELLKLPGVGRKTANVFLSEYGDHAIAVDTHVFYISRKLGWSKNKNPHKVEEDLKKIFSRKQWSMVNPTLVRFGKSHTSRKEKDKLLEEIKRIK